MTNMFALIMSGVLAAVGVASLSTIVGQLIRRFPARIEGKILKSMMRINLLKYAKCALEVEEYPAFCILASAAIEEALRRKLQSTDRHETVAGLFQEGTKRYNLKLDSNDISHIKKLLEAKEEVPTDVLRVDKGQATQMLQSAQRFVSEMRKSHPVRSTT